jgi:hypothetical protein
VTQVLHKPSWEADLKKGQFCIPTIVYDHIIRTGLHRHRVGAPALVAQVGLLVFVDSAFPSAPPNAFGGLQRHGINF